MTLLLSATMLHDAAWWLFFSNNAATCKQWQACSMAGIVCYSNRRNTYIFEYMKPLIVLLVSFVVASVAIKVISGEFDVALAGRIAMAVMLAFTATAHFAFTKGMVMMMPDIIPYKKAVVYITGVLEICAAIGLLVPRLVTSTGWLLIFFFIALIPANIKAAVHHIDYQKGTFEGKGLAYLWFRVPLQLFFIVWTYFTAIRL